MTTSDIIKIVLIVALVADIAVSLYCLRRKLSDKTLDVKWRIDCDPFTRPTSVGPTRDSRGRFARAKVLP